MAKLYNLARMTTATTGTGTITLGAAVSGYLTFALAGVASTDIVDYGIKDGANSESGTGTATNTAGTWTLTRTVTKSTNANAAISLSGTAEVFISPRAETLNDATLFTTGTLTAARLGGMSNLTNSLGANVALNVANTFFDGPSVAQGTAGTWFASGTVVAGGVADTFVCKLWDGTTVIASTQILSNASGSPFALSGIITNPVGNIRISCKGNTTTTGAIFFNATVQGKDSTVSVIRIG